MRVYWWLGMEGTVVYIHQQNGKGGRAVYNGLMYKPWSQTFVNRREG